MNVFGVGNMELVLVLLVALLVLGPGRMVDAARTMRKLWSEAQRTLRAAADAATVRLDEPLLPKTPPRDPVPEPEGAVARDADEDDGESAAEADGGRPEEPRG